MGCGTSTETSEQKRGTSQQLSQTESCQTGNTTARVNVDDVDDRRASIVPPPASGDPRKVQYDPSGSATYAGSGSAPYDRTSFRGDNSQRSVNGEAPMLLSSSTNQQPTSAGNSMTNPPGYDAASEHRASYNRLRAIAMPGADGSFSESMSPTFSGRRGSPSYGIDGQPRSSLSSSITSSMHMAPTANNLSNPYSPTAMGDRQRASCSSMFSNSTNSMPAIRDRNLSILSGTGSDMTSLSSTTKTSSEMARERENQRSVQSGGISPSRPMAALPSSTGEGYLSPMGLNINGNGGSPNMSPGGRSPGQSQTLPPPLALPINACKYPNTLLAYYPPVSGNHHHGLVTVNGKTALQTKTQTYTGKQYLKEYDHDMRKRQEWEEPFVTEMLEGRDMDKYKYRRRGQMPSLTLPVDEAMVQRESSKVKHANFSLSDTGSLKSHLPNNSRHATTQEFLQLQIAERQKAPPPPICAVLSPGQRSAILSPSGSPNGTFSPNATFSPSGSMHACRHRKDLLHAQQLLDADHWEPGGSTNPVPGPASPLVPTSRQQQRESSMNGGGSGNNSAGPNAKEDDTVLNGKTMDTPNSKASTQTPMSQHGAKDNNPAEQRSSNSSLVQVSSTQASTEHGSGDHTAKMRKQDSGATSPPPTETTTNVSPPHGSTVVCAEENGSPLPKHVPGGGQPPAVPMLKSAGSGLNVLRARSNNDASSPGSARGGLGSARLSGRGDRVGLPELTPTSARGDATNPMLAGHHHNAKSIDNSAASMPLSARSSHSLHQQLSGAVQMASKPPKPPQSSESHYEDIPGAILD